MTGSNSSSPSPSPSHEALSTVACNRLQQELTKELNEWKLNPPTGFELKPTDNLQRWEIEVNGAPGTFYANETYQLQVDFPEHYPKEAPQVTFIPPAPPHPHIYSNGHICLGILDSWPPKTTVSSLGNIILSMLSFADMKQHPVDDYWYVNSCKSGEKKNKYVKSCKSGQKKNKYVKSCKSGEKKKNK